MSNSLSINNNLYRYENLVSEYSKYLREVNIKNITFYNPYWKPNINNPLNRIIYIFEGETISTVYELNFVINIAILKRLYYKEKSLEICSDHINLISRYLLQSLLENFKNPEIINLASFKLVYYTNNPKSVDHIYKSDCIFDIEGKYLQTKMNSMIRSLYIPSI